MPLLISLRRQALKTQSCVHACGGRRLCMGILQVPGPYIYTSMHSTLPAATSTLLACTYAKAAKCCCRRHLMN